MPDCSYNSVLYGLQHSPSPLTVMMPDCQQLCTVWASSQSTPIDRDARLLQQLCTIWAVWHHHCQWDARLEQLCAEAHIVQSCWSSLASSLSMGVDSDEAHTVQSCWTVWHHHCQWGWTVLKPIVQSCWMQSGIITVNGGGLC